MYSELANRVERDGVGAALGILPVNDVVAFRDELNLQDLKRSRAGARHILSLPIVSKLSRDPRILGLAQAVLGPTAAPFKATLFDKSPDSNWLVMWHQDTAMPIAERREIEGWGPWSVKEGIQYAHAPARVLERILALRIHLDDSTSTNGPLRVLPGTHQSGVLSDEQIQRLAQRVESVEVTSPPGGVIAMRPLAVHASSKSQSDLPRRVIHIEYCASMEIDCGLELAIA